MRALKNKTDLHDLVQYHSAKILEDFLEESNGEGSFSFKKCIAEDETDAFPLTAFEALNDWNFQAFYVPEHLGGELKNAEEVLLLMRLIARRDLTLAVSHGITLLGAMPIWLSGNKELQFSSASAIMSGESFALGLSEKDHGSDVTNNGLEAKIYGDSELILNGTKWLINQGIRANYITVMAKTAGHKFFRNYSLVHIDKKKYEAEKFVNKHIKTTGLRGLDLGSIQLENLVLDQNCVVGKIGTGLDTSIRTLQVTRFMCLSFSLGAVDTCLRTTIQFLKGRSIYKGMAIELPVVKEKIVRLTSKLLFSEMFSFAGARVLHVLPKEFSLVAAISKGVIPDLMQGTIQELQSLLGARSFLRDNFKDGIFQKMERDHAIIPVFDGNSAVNFQYIISQLRELSNAPIADSYDASLMSQLFDLNEALPAMDFEKLTLTNRRKDVFKAALWMIPSKLESVESQSLLHQEMIIIAKKFIAHWEKLDQLILQDASNLSNAYTIPAVFFDYAKQFSYLHIASACLNIWLYNSEKKGSVLFSEHWVLLALQGIADEIKIPYTSFSQGLTDIALDQIIKIVDNDQLISGIPFNVK